LFREEIPSVYQTGRNQRVPHPDNFYTNNINLKEVINLEKYFKIWGHAVAQLVVALLQIGRKRFRFSMRSLHFFIGLTLPTALWSLG
jgi:hypothetical protein